MRKNSTVHTCPAGGHTFSQDTTRTCLSCGKAFQAKPSKIAKGLALFCSQPCYWQQSRGRITRPIIPVPDRFWPKVKKADGCWEWIGSRDAHGYGTFNINRKTDRAHRVSWELANGVIPDGMIVCHHCDNPPCVRPDHLFLGSHSDNSADAYRKGRKFIPRRSRRVRPELP
jgi:HNH endonuclease